ncbi:MAG: serine/threonine-protein kinase [Candidatus Solibacter sp.]
MKIQRVSSETIQAPGAFARRLPPEILERATDGLGWVSLISAASSITLALIHQLQPEFATAWQHPALRLAILSVLLLSLGFMVVQRSGLLSKQRLLDLGMVFQVVVAFACALCEGSAYQDSNAVVIGHSRIALWMMVCGRLMPNAPLKATIASIFCVLMWPLGYWADLQLYGYQPMPFARMLAWILPLAIVAVWMYFLNKRVITLCLQQQRAEDMGSYTLTDRIGRGGMGEVWRARHKTLARDAAIKVIRPEILQSSTVRQEQLLLKRFEREAQVTASLRSPHTVALYDFGQAKDGSFYYVMELLEGIDLQTLVERFGPMEPARVADILRQISQSLEEAHRAGLVHRDIKPRNILIGKLGLQYDFAKVLDFGLVKMSRLDDPERTATTMDGGATGTPAYLSPEVALGSQDIDGRADLYSLGCTAYFLLTGKMVFDAPSPTAYAIAHVQSPPMPIRERSDLPVPYGLEAIVMQLLEKDPADRIQSAQLLERRLRALDLNAWSPERAEQWWETHLPNLAKVAKSNEETAPTQEMQYTHA